MAYLASLPVPISSSDSYSALVRHRYGIFPNHPFIYSSIHLFIHSSIRPSNHSTIQSYPPIFSPSYLLIFLPSQHLQPSNHAIHPIIHPSQNFFIHPCIHPTMLIIQSSIHPFLFIPVIQDIHFLQERITSITLSRSLLLIAVPEGNA